MISEKLERKLPNYFYGSWNILDKPFKVKCKRNHFKKNKIRNSYKIIKTNHCKSDVSQINICFFGHSLVCLISTIEIKESHFAKDDSLFLFNNLTKVIF